MADGRRGGRLHEATARGGRMRRNLRGAMMTAIESDDSGMIMERIRRNRPTQLSRNTGIAPNRPQGHDSVSLQPQSTAFRAEGQITSRHPGTSRIPAREERLNSKDIRRCPQYEQQEVTGKPVPEEQKTPIHATGTRKPAPVHHDDAVSRYRDNNNRPRTPRRHILQPQGQQHGRHTVPIQHKSTGPRYRDTKASPCTPSRRVSRYRDKNAANPLSRYTKCLHCCSSRTPLDIQRQATFSAQPPPPAEMNHESDMRGSNAINHVNAEHQCRASLAHGQVTSQNTGYARKHRSLQPRQVVVPSCM